MSALFSEALDRKMSCFDIGWKTDGTKKGHMDSFDSFSFLLFCF